MVDEFNDVEDEAAQADNLQEPQDEIEEQPDEPVKKELEAPVHHTHPANHSNPINHSEDRLSENKPSHQEKKVQEKQVHEKHPEKHDMPAEKHDKNQKHDKHDSNHEYHKSNIFLELYHNHYKNLMIFSILLLVLSVGLVGYRLATTGDFVSKGITLKGGITLTINTQQNVDTDMLQSYLTTTYPKSDINVRSFQVGQVSGFVVEATDATQDQLLSAIRTKVANISDSDYSSETTGSSLGSSFFTQTLKAIFVAFLFMSLVVYLYFGESLKIKWLTGLLSIASGLMMFYATSLIFYIISLLIFIVLIVIYFRTNIPSFGIMLCAFSDIFFSLAIFNLMNLKLNTAGVAAFLMLVGYSIDTDILLAVRVLKRKEGTIFERTIGAMKTGMMMSLCALIAVLAAYFLTHSSVIKEIMFILAIGLIGDVIFTWIQNAGILRWHLEKKGWK